jgi:Nitrile hydratase, alpha chain
MRTEYTERLVDRAERDDEFRARLLSDPKAAISEELGVEIPRSLTIRVIEEGPSEVIMALPAKAAAGELSEEQLVSVSGGSTWSWCTPGTQCTC